MGHEPRTVLVTGATGFLGRAVVDRFARDGHRVIAASRSAVERGGAPAGVRTCFLDITRPETIEPALAGVDVVVHAAGKIGDWGTREDFFAPIRDGTKNLVDACVGRSLSRFVHVSSVLFYGVRGSAVMTESMLPGDCPWPYAEAKVLAEDLVRRAHTDHELPTVILRPSNIFGPGSANWTERPATLAGRGLLSLPPDAGKANLVYVDNVAAAILAASFHPAAVGQAYNVVDEAELGWQELFSAYAEALGTGVVTTRPLWLLYSLATTMETWARVTGGAPLITRNAIDFLRFRGTYARGKLEERLDYRAEVPFAEAMTRTLDYLRQRRRR